MREFLKGLGFDEETINSIMAEHGKLMEGLKSKIEKDTEDIKSQLEEARNSLKSFEGIDVNNLQAEIAKLNQSLKDKDDEYNAKIAERDFNDLLNGAISSKGGKNVKAIIANLDVETLKASKNQKEDIESALETFKKDNDYLFNSDEPIKNPVGPTGNQGGNGNLDDNALRAIMGLPEKK